MRLLQHIGVILLHKINQVPNALSWRWLILISLIIPLFALDIHAIDFGTIEDDCRLMIRDTGQSRQRFSRAQLLRFANDAQEDIIINTLAIRESNEFDLVSGTTYYSLPSNFLRMYRVTRDYQVLPEKSIASLDKNQEWEEVSGLPINYYIHFASRGLVAFYPFPDSESVTGKIRYNYMAQPDDLSGDTDTPFNGIAELQPYGYVLSFYCAYRASLVDGSPMAQQYFGEYQRGVQRISEDAVARPNYKPGAMGSGRRQ